MVYINAVTDRIPPAPPVRAPLAEEAKERGSVRMLQREIIGLHLRQVARDVAVGRYWARLHAATLLFVLVGALPEAAEMLGMPLNLALNEIGLVRGFAVAIAVIATLVTGALWWSARQQDLRNQLRLLTIRLNLDDAGIPTESS